MELRQPDRGEFCPSSPSPSDCPRIFGTNFLKKVNALYISSKQFLWNLFLIVKAQAITYSSVAFELYEIHLYPHYLAHLHPTVQYLYRQYLFFLNTPVMVEVLAYFDFLIRKFHVLFYRLEVDLPRYFNSFERFSSIIFYRMFWNIAINLERFAFTLSRLPMCSIFDGDEWYFIINVALIIFIGIVVIVSRRVIYSIILWIVGVITFPIRSLFRFFFPKKTLTPPSPPSQSDR